MRTPLRPLTLCVSLLALAACTEFDMDMRDLGNAFDTTGAARAVSVAPRPDTDSRGVISYPNYQVVVARRGDTVSEIARRIGMDAVELARFNGIPEETVMGRGEILALPRRIPAAGSAASSVSAGPVPVTSVVPSGGQVDVTSLAGAAIERAAPVAASPVAPAPVTQSGPEPVRHKVVRGETGYSIARKYGVGPADLAKWNGLDRNLSLREGQFLLIPPVDSSKPADTRVAAIAQPGTGSVAPVPPSAAAPLPDEKPVPAAAAGSTAPQPKPAGTPASPNLGASQTAASASKARMVTPVSGSIIRAFSKGKSEGLDIAAPAGTPVKAAAAGTVAAITRDTDQVPILVLRHDGGVLTVYANVDNLKVSKGQTVSRGQQIAAVRAGDSSFLHFEVREGLDAVDPAGYLN